MKDNKLYKVLRIIFLTLAILSMVFSLSKKFVHAADSGGDSEPEITTSLTEFPLPFGGSSGIGYGDYPLTSSIASGALDYAHNLYPYDFRLVCINEVASDNSYITFRVYVTDSDFFLSSGTYPYLSNALIRNLGSYGSIVVKWDGSSYSEYQGYSYTQYYDVPVSNWLTYVDGVLTLNTEDVLYNYPVYYSGGNITGRNGVLFAQYLPPVIDFDGLGFGDISGSITPSQDYDGKGFDFDLDISIDLNPLQVLGEEIRDGIGTLKDRVVEGFQTIGGKIDTFKDRVVEGFQTIGGKIDTFKDRVVEGFQTLTSIPSKVSDIYDYITEPFDEEKFSEKFEEMELGQEFTTFRTDIESFTGTFNVAPAAAEDVRFSIPFTLPYVNQNLQAVIDFSFYDRIRSIVVPFFTVFLIFGMVWSLIRSIPGILHGTSPDGDS